MDNLKEIQKEYLRYKEILHKVSDGDDKSMEAVLLRQTWDTESLGQMRDIIKSYEDQGILLTMN